MGADTLKAMQLLLLSALTGCYLQQLEDTAAPRDCEQRSLFYVDADGDGLGDETQKIIACEQPSGAVTEAGDCDDSDPTLTDDCGDSTLCADAGEADDSSNSFSNTEFPECPDPLTAPHLGYEAPELSRYALLLGCTVDTGCQDGDRSALALSCASQAAYGEDETGAETTPEAPATLTLSLNDAYALIPALEADAQLGVLLFGEGEQRWAAVYDAGYALQLGWVDSAGAYEPSADLMTAVGLEGVPLFGTLSLEDATETCPWDDDSQRGRDLGVLATQGEQSAVLGPMAWTELDGLRLHTGAMRLDLDGDNARTLLIVGLD